MPTLDRPRIHVDFNEMVAENFVMLSRNDSVADSSGAQILLSPGMRVYLYDDDRDDHGESSYLLATGLVELNPDDGWSRHVRWCCRIDRW